MWAASRQMGRERGKYLEYPVMIHTADVKIMPIAFPHADAFFIRVRRRIEAAQADGTFVTFKIFVIQERAVCYLFKRVPAIL